MPSSWQEMLACMQDFETSTAVTANEEMQELREAAEEAATELQKPSAAVDLKDLDDEEREELHKSSADCKFAKTWWKWSISLAAADARSSEGHDAATDLATGQSDRIAAGTGDPSSSVETDSVSLLREQATQPLKADVPTVCAGKKEEEEQEQK